MLHTALRLRSRSSLAMLAIALAFAGAACKSEKTDDSSAAEALGSAAHADGRHPRELPQAAFDACSGKAVGDLCTVQLGDKPLEAKCAAVPDGRVACRPNHKRPEGG